MIVGIIYLNGRKGRLQAEIALQTGADIGADVVVIAEALVESERRPTHGTYDLTWNSKYLPVYTRKDRQIRVRGQDGGKWAMIGGNIAAAYLPPQLSHQAGERALERMVRAGADTLLSNLNCCGESKKRVL